LKKSLILCIILLISSLFSVFPILSAPTAAQTSTFSLSGYVLDSNGNGVAGANVNFNGAIPSANTNSKGYYATSGPAGTYQIYVWPPFNSSYINYDEAGFTIASDATKNITLQTGCKISGYIIDSAGTPMVGASVLFRISNKVYGSGWFTNSAGYYFINVPAGIYTIDAHPQTAFNPSYTGPCTPFTTYYEYNFAVSSNIDKNITVSGTQTTATPTPTAQPTTAPTTTPSPTPIPTLAPSLKSTHVSISVNAPSSSVGSSVNINGKLTDATGNPLASKTITLSYKLPGSSNNIPIGSDTTNTAGEYSLQWVNTASGTFTLKVDWTGDTTYRPSSNTTLLNFLPYQNQNVFLVESNSTVTALAFNSTSSEFSFTVSGSSGTTGYVKTTIAKNLTTNPENIKVYLDDNQLNYTVTSNVDSWQLTFNYHHSTHTISIVFAAESAVPEFSWLMILLLFFSILFFVVLIRQRKVSWAK
jgi:hypothetical protein